MPTHNIVYNLHDWLVMHLSMVCPTPPPGAGGGGGGRGDCPVCEVLTPNQWGMCESYLAPPFSFPIPHAGKKNHCTETFMLLFDADVYKNNGTPHIHKIIVHEVLDNIRMCANSQIITAQKHIHVQQ